MNRKLTAFLCLMLFLAISVLFIGCEEEGTTASSKTPEEMLADSIATIAAQEANRQADLKAQLQNAPIYYCGDALVVVRQEPNLSSAEVDEVTLGEGLRFGGELGGDSTGVMINDEVSIDQFALVLTPRGQIGWVHKGILQKERPGDVVFGTNLPISLQLIKGSELAVDAWQNMYLNMGECEGAGCPRFFVNGGNTFMLMEVCDPIADFEPGIHLFYPNGKKQHFLWWEDFYGTQSCHLEGNISYQIEKMTKAGESILELRLSYEFDEQYGEYLLELTDDTTPFVLEEKTGSKDS